MKLKIGHVTLDSVLNLSVVHTGEREELVAVGDVGGKRERVIIPTNDASAELVFDAPQTMMRASEPTPAPAAAPSRPAATTRKRAEKK